MTALWIGIVCCVVAVDPGAPGLARAGGALPSAPPALADDIVDEDEAAWQARIGRIGEIQDADEALRQVDAIERELRASLRTEPTSQARRRLAELQLRCRVPRVSMMQKGRVSMEAIDLLEKVVEEEPDHVYARFLLAKTCLGMPAFLGRADDAERHLEHLYALEGKSPGAVPFPDVFVDLAGIVKEEDGARAREIVERGLGRFPENRRLQALRAELSGDAPAAPTPRRARADGPESLLDRLAEALGRQLQERLPLDQIPEELVLDIPGTELRLRIRIEVEGRSRRRPPPAPAPGKESSRVF